MAFATVSGALHADAPCAAPGWLGQAESAPRELASPPAHLAERLTVRFADSCMRPFVVELELRLLFSDRRAPLLRRSAPREFRPGERFLPGEAYLVSRAFPESEELFTALFEHADCGSRRIVGSLPLAAGDPDPDPGAHRAACVLVVGVPETVRGAGDPPPGARVAVFLGGASG